MPENLRNTTVRCDRCEWFRLGLDVDYPLFLVLTPHRRSQCEHRQSISAGLVTGAERPKSSRTTGVSAYSPAISCSPSPFYVGRGWLLILNRLKARGSLEWSLGVVFPAVGGFVGNFALLLLDHAQNGFFHDGAPVFAPLLFTNLALLASLVLCSLPRAAPAAAD
jgi:hypothetical protein